MSSFCPLLRLYVLLNVWWSKYTHITCIFFIILLKTVSFNSFKLCSGIYSLPFSSWCLKIFSWSSRNYFSLNQGAVSWIIYFFRTSFEYQHKLAKYALTSVVLFMVPVVIAIKRLIAYCPWRLKCIIKTARKSHNPFHWRRFSAVRTSIISEQDSVTSKMAKWKLRVFVKCHFYS